MRISLGLGGAYFSHKNENEFQIISKYINEPVHRLLDSNPELCILHGNAVEINGFCIGLVGKTCVGKTSSSINLIKNHHGKYMSDDVIIVDKSGYVHASMERPILNRNGTVSYIYPKDLFLEGEIFHGAQKLSALVYLGEDDFSSKIEKIMSVLWNATSHRLAKIMAIPFFAFPNNCLSFDDNRLYDFIIDKVCGERMNE